MGGQGGFKAAVKESPRQRVIDDIDLGDADDNVAVSDVFSVEGQNTLKGYVTYTGDPGVLTLTVLEEDPEVPGDFTFPATTVDAAVGTVSFLPLVFDTTDGDKFPFAIPVMGHNCIIQVTHETNDGVVRVVLRNGVTV